MATIPRQRRTFTRSQRRQYLEQFQGSGLAQAEFCRRTGLSPATFSHWRRQPAAVAFAEVELRPPALATSRRAPGLGGAAVLQLRDGTSLELALGDESGWAGLGLMLKTFQS